MKISATVTGSIRALSRNPTRALLTMLGIIIGIGAVITMMEIGQGADAVMKENIESMGVNTLVVMPGAPRVPGGKREQGGAMSLKPEDCEAILRDCPSVAFAAPVVNSSGLQFVFGNQNWTPRQIVGTSCDYFNIRDWKISDGRVFTPHEVESRASVCVVGQTIVKEIFGGASPVDCTVRIKNVAFTVIGVLEKKGANMMGMDEDDVVIAPWTTIRLRITGLKTGSATNTTSTATTSPGSVYPGEGVAFYPEQAENLAADTLLIPKFTQIDQIMVGAASPDKVADAEREIHTVLRAQHALPPEKDDDFHIRNSAAFMEMFSQTTNQMANLLLAVALISLIVGGVGIMNIMLVSVTERTREIGLRMAVGARARDILFQFLVESMLLCAIGGIIGIIGGHGAALAVHHLKGWPVMANAAIMSGAFLVSTFVGVIFGFYPAWKASRLDPIEALRYE